MKTIKDFSENYGMLYDAVINSVFLSYITKLANSTITVDLECMSIPKNEEWVSLKIIFSDIQEFKISSDYYHSINSIENFCMSIIEDKIVFDFIPYIICPNTIEEHRKSLFYIVFKKLDFEEIKLD